MGAPGRPLGRSPRWGQALVVAAGLIPAVRLAVGAARDTLGADPAEALLHGSGDWALRLLLATLAVTPLRRWLGWRGIAPYRRTLGLLAFGYACVHVACYVTLDLGLAWAELGSDILERPYITVGFLALVGMVPLALTSTRAAVRRLGGRRWTRLHRLVYAVAAAAVLHFAWGVKADLLEPVLYAGVLAMLLAARAPRRLPPRATPTVS